MMHLLLTHFGGDEIFSSSNFGMWMFVSIGAIALFAVFLPLATFFGSRQKEREAFYRADIFRRLAEASGEGAKAALAALREEDRLKQVKAREGMKVGGLICVAVGIALTIMLRSQHDPSFLVGLIPGGVGLALLIYALFLAAPIDRQPNG